MRTGFLLINMKCDTQPWRNNALASQATATPLLHECQNLMLANLYVGRSGCPAPTWALKTRLMWSMIRFLWAELAGKCKGELIFGDSFSEENRFSPNISPTDTIDGMLNMDNKFEEPTRPVTEKMEMCPIWFPLSLVALMLKVEGHVIFEVLSLCVLFANRSMSLFILLWNGGALWRALFVVSRSHKGSTWGLQPMLN